MQDPNNLQPEDQENQLPADTVENTGTGQQDVTEPEGAEGDQPAPPAPSSDNEPEPNTAAANSGNTGRFKPQFKNRPPGGQVTFAIYLDEKLVLDRLAAALSKKYGTKISRNQIARMAVRHALTNSKADFPRKSLVNDSKILHGNSNYEAVIQKLQNDQ